LAAQGLHFAAHGLQAEAAQGLHLAAHGLHADAQAPHFFFAAHALHAEAVQLARAGVTTAGAAAIRPPLTSMRARAFFDFVCIVSLLWGLQRPGNPAEGSIDTVGP